MDLTEPVLLTPEGLERLKAELEVQRARRVEAADRLKEAFQPGDIEDNPEYEQAKEEVGLIDGRIYELDEMIGRAEIIHEHHSSFDDRRAGLDGRGRRRRVPRRDLSPGRRGGIRPRRGADLGRLPGGSRHRRQEEG